MIEPQVLHGGASSWFFIAANSEVFFAGLSSVRLTSGRLKPPPTRRDTPEP
jgi:hypothetical protein